jgi:uncharacterized protein DUF5684
VEPHQLAAGSSNTGGLIAGLLVGLVVVVFMIAAMWKVFSKAGKPGWAAIIPIYNTYVLCKVAGRPGWWTVLFFIPLVDIVISIIVALDVAKAFGKGGAFGFFLLWLLPIIGYPILGYGGATYQGGRPVEQQPVGAY